MVICAYGLIVGLIYYISLLAADFTKSASSLLVFLLRSDSTRQTPCITTTLRRDRQGRNAIRKLSIDSLRASLTPTVRCPRILTMTRWRDMTLLGLIALIRCMVAQITLMRFPARRPGIPTDLLVDIHLLESALQLVE